MSSRQVAILPNDGRSIYINAIDDAKVKISIEICVLEDPEILAAIQKAIERGVSVQALVDRGKYLANTAEQQNLAKFITGCGGQLRLSNPIFPRSFPKVILVDQRFYLVGSACLDEITFNGYRDFVVRDFNSEMYFELNEIFENDWNHSTEPNGTPPNYNPTPAISVGALIVAPVNATSRIVSFLQSASKTLDVYSEMLGNPTLSSELIAAAKRGVRVRLICPATVNNATLDLQTIQQASIASLIANGVSIKTSGPTFNTNQPYMHARAMIADSQSLIIGSISLSRDSATVNRGISILVKEKDLIEQISQQFEADFNCLNYSK